LDGYDTLTASLDLDRRLCDEASGFSIAIFARFGLPSSHTVIVALIVAYR
jgi:hypothetical protein